MGKKRFYVVWFLFACFLIIQHRFVFMHFDDWGYASLSYAYTGNSNGMNWNISDFVSFLKWHYFNWGGRILWFAIEIIALRCGEWCIQLLQAFFLFFVYFSSYLLVKRKNEDFATSFLIILTYGFISLPTVSNGVFWFTASVLYVWPFSCLFGAIYILEYKNTTIKCKVLSSVLLFFAAFSQEQVAVLTSVYIIISIIVNEKERRKKLAPYCVGILASAIEVFAPGNFIRSEVSTTQNLNIIEKSVIQSSNVLNTILSDFFTVFLLFVTFIYLLIYFGKKRTFGKYFYYVITVDVFVSGAFLFTTIENSGNSLVFQLLFCLIFCIQILVYLIERKLNTFFALFIGAICSQVMMLVAPYMVERCVLPFKFIMNLITIYIIIEEAKEFKQSLNLVTSLMLIISIGNMGWITKGYVTNGQVNLINRYKLQEKSAQYNAGTPVNDIILYRLPDDRFVSQMPYQQEFIEEYLKIYYKLPQETNIIWQNLNEYEYEYDTVDEKNPQISTIWPDVIDADFERSEDGGVNIAVTPSRIDSNLCIVVNGIEMESTKDSSVYTTHINKQLLSDDLTIRLYDKESERYSEAVTLIVQH